MLSSYWFYILLVLLVVSVVAIAILAHKLASKKTAERDDKSIYDERLALFMDAARQIRTPLLLMKEPLDSILKSSIVDPSVRSNLLILESNTDRILDVSDRLLSANDVDSNKYKSILLESEDWNVRTDRMDEDVDVSDTRETPLILIVENDLELRMFISDQLKKSYSVLSVPDAFEALRVLETNDVNLVICDSDIPEFKGTELCEYLNTNMDYSHIPVILMTSDSNVKSRIEIMQSGADASIEKPFPMNYLVSVIQNLLETRERLRKKYASSPWLGISTIALSDADTLFLTRLHEIIQKKMEDPQLSVDSIADSMNMSRSSFYRKIKGLTDMGPNSFLQLERLKKAAQLLKEGNLRINEIYYSVGFSSSSYFAKCFQKQFGVLPKDYR